jgi:predicted membrane chloride channel (bestrophin family)
MTATSDGSKKIKIESMLLLILFCQILPEKCLSRLHSSTAFFFYQFVFTIFEGNHIQHLEDFVCI